jgi:hypothetical protein
MLSLGTADTGGLSISGTEAQADNSTNRLITKGAERIALGNFIIFFFGDPLVKTFIRAKD